MKIVIDIDDKIYNDSKNGYVRLGEITDAVLSGTPIDDNTFEKIIDLTKGLTMGEVVILEKLVNGYAVYRQPKENKTLLFTGTKDECMEFIIQNDMKYILDVSVEVWKATHGR